MPFDFPAPPLTIGQVYHPSAGIDYVWTGACWDRLQPPAATFKMPAAIVDQYAGTVLPVGALWCDGKTFDQAVYPLLYQALGDKNVVPDYRGRVGLGKDDMGGSVGGPRHQCRPRRGRLRRQGARRGRRPRPLRRHPERHAAAHARRQRHQRHRERRPLRTRSPATPATTASITATPSTSTPAPRASITRTGTTLGTSPPGRTPTA